MATVSPLPKSKAPGNSHPYPQIGWLNILVDVFRLSNRTGVSRAWEVALLPANINLALEKPRRGGLFIARTAQKRSFLFVFQRREGRAAEKQKEMLIGIAWLWL